MVALPLFFALLFGRRRAPSTLGAGLAAAALIARINQAPALPWLLGCHLWSLVRRQRREAALAAAVVAVIVLMPAAHNLYYGGELVFTTRGIGVSESIGVLPDDHRGTWEEIADRTIGQLRGVLYDQAAILSAPLVFLAPHLFYWAIPRHIVSRTWRWPRPRCTPWESYGHRDRLRA